ncbi:hypothetical protein [Sphingomonas jatrophae]|uniref:Uncharacterized protein n=1 Tax=Sphingomonas jatrophae TaxID=1166337 RepID=A0A1I6JRE4_9SPHN|nr:hypothetical protein [Sphingomonas jatrophae]SFR81488.1 hypothetical protein SAMN05192580_0712 [Sphingomonas jatrophae]
MAAPHISRSLLALAVALALGGCGRKAEEVDALDSELIGNAANQTDPALTAALEDQIMVDPALAQHANDHALRSPDSLPQAPIPPAAEPAAEAACNERPTLGEMAEQHGGEGAAGCYAGLAYSQVWANRLPAGVPLFRDAAVDEAAGNDAPGCGTRVVSYASAAPAPTLVAFYLARTRAAGYAAGHVRRGGDEVVAGERPDGAAAYVAITPQRGGSAVNIVVSGGG